MKKDMIKSLLKKYNKQNVKVVSEIDPEVAGSSSNGKDRVVFDITGKDLLVQDVVTKDNIHLYYKYMSDDDLIKNRAIISDELEKRRDEIVEYFKDKISLKNKGSFFGVSGMCNADISAIIKLDIIFGSYLLRQLIFGAKDTLKPIEEYIEEIKASEAYKAYMAEKA